MNGLTLRVTGFVLSLTLTLIAYFIMIQPHIFHFSSQMAIIMILSLAIAQAIVQLIFFINVWKEKGTLWNLGIFVSTVSILFVVVFFSIWIMNHLNNNMH